MATSAWMHGAAAMRLTEGLVSVLKEQRPEYLSEVLTNYREHGVFPTQGASDVAGLVGFCNAKLSSSKTRLEGLCLLSMLVKDSSSDLFQQHCLSWLRSLQQVIQSQAPCQSIQLAVSILQDLLQYSCQLAELAREVGLNSILGILMSLLGLKTECERAAMEGMRACMIYYPRACGSLKDKLGAYLLSKMDSTSRKTQEMACQGYSLLPCLGGLADRSAGTGRAEGWTNQIQCLLASANGILAQIYQGSETDEAVQYRGPGVELPFPHLDQTDPLLLLQLQHRYTAVCLVLKHTLRADPASAVHLPVRPILNLVCRALAVNSRNTSLTADGSLRLLVLPSVHISTLEVLAELITVVRSGMVQYAAVLQKLFSQMLCAWTAVPEANVGQQRAYSSVRVSVYRTLELWLQLVGASANVLQGASSHAELLFTHLLADITPGAESIKLRAGLSADVVPGGKPGPRRTKQLVMADPVGASLQRKGDPVSNQDTCLSALKVLRRIIQTSGTLLKNDIHKRLHEVVLPLCVRLQQQQTSSITACESVGGVSGQYSSALTRRQLYRLLLALVLVPSPCWPPPLTCTVSILSNGRLDRNLKVSSFCSEALTICNSLLHPRVPSIALPLPPLALKPPPTASVLSGPGPAPRLTLPTLLGGPTPGPPFPGRHPLSLGPNSLLGSLENHLSLVPGMPGPASAPGDLLLSPHGQPQPDPAGLGLPDGQRPVFVRYDKEEAEDVEISLASDSDDSVVIVPPGMLGSVSQLDDPAPGSQNLLSAGAGAGVPLPGGDTVAMVPSTAAPASLDVTSLPNDLVPTSSTPANSFPSSSGSVVSLVTSLTPGSAPPPAGGLVDPVAVKPQLQQMLLQPPAPGPQGPPGSVALPLQVQLQNQLAQQGRHLHQHPPPAPPSNQDSAVININSTDDEDEDEEDMEDDEELEEEEEEDGLDEEEEGSEDFYEGEEYEDFDDEEAEELEEEEEDEDGDMPPLEGSEDKSEEVTMEEEEEEEEEEKALGAEEEEGEGAGFNPEGGIEELQSSRALFGEERMKVQEVESIGVLEEARGGDRGDGEDDSERMDDPSMPQILCVTGGALEERADSSQEAAQAAGELQDQLTLWDQNHQQNPPTGASEEEPTAHSQEESVAEREQEAGVREEVALEAELQEEEEPVVVQEEAAAGASGGEETPAAPHDPQQDQTDTQQGYETQAEWTKPVGEQGEKEEESNTEEEEKGMKRKREEEVIEDEARPSPEKKKDDEAMASMLADFIACPPDDEDVASGSNQS
ncbi:proline-, glutamic acid- and leucine-rich protein 1 isoform X2 [Xiphophorus maculatus]|uniref:proline-, glutamic acid- and leucine-rich protein 1 isoform X2 n=1 Tax=Xiphophorus maculatus TaxID=8083 RepID=UPI000C6D2A30|nr:proline-, glutamic acid- and leucine-rich protein 1 isoform X2 [Xiphophorus maculatus]